MANVENSIVRTFAFFFQNMLLQLYGMGSWYMKIPQWSFVIVFCLLRETEREEEKIIGEGKKIHTTFHAPTVSTVGSFTTIIQVSSTAQC